MSATSSDIIEKNLLSLISCDKLFSAEHHLVLDMKSLCSPWKTYEYNGGDKVFSEINESYVCKCQGQQIDR